eukprot:9161572-Alexandrium_andersonii.AAC.1
MASKRGRLRATNGRRATSRASRSPPPLLLAPARQAALRPQAVGREPRARAANKRSAGGRSRVCTGWHNGERRKGKNCALQHANNADEVRRLVGNLAWPWRDVAISGADRRGMRIRPGLTHRIHFIRHKG